METKYSCMVYKGVQTSSYRRLQKINEKWFVTNVSDMGIRVFDCNTLKFAKELFISENYEKTTKKKFDNAFEKQLEYFKTIK